MTLAPSHHKFAVDNRSCMKAAGIVHSWQLFPDPALGVVDLGRREHVGVPASRNNELAAKVSATSPESWSLDVRKPRPLLLRWIVGLDTSTARATASHDQLAFDDGGGEAAARTLR